jgi:membrane protease YdiL (CAAX protease family)
MTTAAVLEEPLFRGFLWGYLRRWHWPNVLIWLFQAALFTLGHIYYLKEEAFVPWLIRMMLPALLIGFIAWQARSIFAGMVTHGVFNASTDMLLHTRSLAEAIYLSWSIVVILTGILAAVWILEWLRRRRASAIC